MWNIAENGVADNNRAYGVRCVENAEHWVTESASGRLILCDACGHTVARKADNDMGSDTTESLTAEAIAEVELVEGSEDDAHDMHITDVVFPDYADVQRLENIAWSADGSPTAYQMYASEYHKLAVKYTEDVLTDCINQYYNGKPW